VSLAQEAGASDVLRKRKADDDNQIYDWQNDERAFQVMVNQYEKNETIGTKLIKGAEAAVVKAKGVAESKVIAAGADIKKAEAHAIRVGADGKKRLDDAEANKIEAETALLQFELEQKRKAAGNGTGAKQSETEDEKERRLTTNRKRRESRAEAKGKPGHARAAAVAMPMSRAVPSASAPTAPAANFK